MSEKKDAAESSDSLETLAANLSGEDKMKMISLLSRSMIWISLPQTHDSELIDPFLNEGVHLRTDLWFASLLEFVEKLRGELQLQMQSIKFPFG